MDILGVVLASRNSAQWLSFLDPTRDWIYGASALKMTLFWGLRGGERYETTVALRPRVEP